MMSSDEEACAEEKRSSTAVAAAVGSKKRPRQRVDAGEPRNSYSQLTVPGYRPNGYIMSPGSKLLSDLLARQKEEEGLNGVHKGSNGYYSEADLYAAHEMLNEHHHQQQMLRETLAAAQRAKLDEDFVVSGGHGSETPPPPAPPPGSAGHGPTAVVEAEKESDSDGGRMSSASGRSRSSSPAALDVKRARVETIVSNMLQGPAALSRSPAPATPTAPAGKAPSQPVNGCKKRKLYQPQQHEARLLDDEDETEEEEDEEGEAEDEDEDDEEPLGKRRRMDRKSLKTQLSQMQEQLAVLQQRYLELCEAQVPPPPPTHPDDEDCGSLADCDRQPGSPASADSKIHSTARQSCIVKPNPSSSPLLVSCSDDLEWLVEALKSEISSTLSQVIDAIVTRYAERKANSNGKTSDASATSGHKEFQLLSQMLDRKSPRTKVIDRGAARLTNGHHHHSGSNGQQVLTQRSSPFPEVKILAPSAKSGSLYSGSPGLTAMVPYSSSQVNNNNHSSSHTLLTNSHPALSTTPELPEQTEAMSLVVAPKKKRHKVTDTRITPRTVSRLLGQDLDPKYASLLSLPPTDSPFALHPHPHHPPHHHHHPVGPPPPPPPLVPVSLPTTVAIPNPSLHQSDVFSTFHFERIAASHFPGRDSPDEDSYLHGGSPSLNSSAASLLGGTPAGHASPPDHYGSLHATPTSHHQHMKQEVMAGDVSDAGDSQGYDTGLAMHTSTLTPMHLRKAKLMFFYVRYPSSAILKMYFPDIKFNKNNTAQLVKWFSNFREFYYIQMEKYARQGLSEGVKNTEDLKVGPDSELLRVLNLHYNRNNHIEVPEHFRFVVENTLREFFKAIVAGKDQEQSWKKTIYKIIARLDDGVPEYFKSPNFLEQLE